MTTKAELYQLIDELPENATDEAARQLSGLRTLHNQLLQPIHGSHGQVDKMIDRFRLAVSELDKAFSGERLADENVEVELRRWLDGRQKPLSWTYSDRVTPDEWFFITTLYGTMSLDGQRSHIRKYFPELFVNAAKRDVRNFVPGMSAYLGLRQPWMAPRLYQMGRLLRERACTMADYVDLLRRIDRAAKPDDPMPALDRIIRDHGATGWKTLSVFVRDCVGGNAFPIDSRVERTLKRYGIPEDERQLVSLSLVMGRNPRQLARMFYEAGVSLPSAQELNTPASVAETTAPAPEESEATSMPKDDQVTPGFFALWVKFETDDAGYLTWLDRHPNGYVLNSERPPNKRYLKLHRPRCSFLQRAIDKGQNLTGAYMKVCSETVAGIKVWTRSECQTDPDDKCYCMR